MRAGDGTGTEGPKSVGRYQIRRWLTSGAMGEIYEALDPVIDRRVAIKIVRRDLNQGDDALVWLDRFRQEVRAAGRLLHPNIVTVLDCGEDSGAPFLAMEYLPGGSLGQRLKYRGRLPAKEAARLVEALAQAAQAGDVAAFAKLARERTSRHRLRTWKAPCALLHAGLSRSCCSLPAMLATRAPPT